RRAHAIQLGGQSPGAMLPHSFRKPQPGRSNDQRHGRLSIAARGLQGVIAKWPGAWNLERRLTNPALIDLARRRPVLELAQLTTTLPGLEFDPYRDRAAGRYMDPHRGVALLSNRHTRRQHLSPRVSVMFRQSGGGVSRC